MIDVQKGACNLDNDKDFDREAEQKNENIQIQNMGGGSPFFRRLQDEQLRNVPPFTPLPETLPDGSPQLSGRGEPRTAPPNFTPELPAGVERFGPEGGRQFGGMGPGRPGQGRYDREEFNRRRRELRRCLRRFTYIWLFNGEDFWFFPINVDDVFVIGFRWRRNRWVFDRIFIRRIIFFRCF